MAGVTPIRPSESRDDVLPAGMADVTHGWTQYDGEKTVVLLLTSEDGKVVLNRSMAPELAEHLASRPSAMAYRVRRMTRSNHS